MSTLFRTVVQFCLPLFAAVLLPGAALADKPRSSSPPSVPHAATARTPQAVVYSVFHGPVVLALAAPELPSHRLGVLRVLPATAITDATGAELGRLDAQLVTSTIDYPTAGDEVRMSVLVFSFGQGTGSLSGLADQLVVSGSGFYAGSQDTVSAGTTLVRPITGGTGRFAGARGWADSEHLGDDSWRHTFHFLKD